MTALTHDDPWGTVQGDARAPFGFTANSSRMTTSGCVCGGTRRAAGGSSGAIPFITLGLANGSDVYHAPDTGSGGGAPIATRIHRGNQQRHIKGHPYWEAQGRGGYFLSETDAQAVLDAYHSGNATIFDTKRNGEIAIRFDGVTGYNMNPSAGYVDQPTHVFIIKGTVDVCIVPYNPAWKP